MKKSTVNIILAILVVSAIAYFFYNKKSKENTDVELASEDNTGVTTDEIIGEPINMSSESPFNIRPVVAPVMVRPQVLSTDSAPSRFI